MYVIRPPYTFTLRVRTAGSECGQQPTVKNPRTSAASPAAHVSALGSLGTGRSYAGWSTAFFVTDMNKLLRQ